MGYKIIIYKDNKFYKKENLNGEMSNQEAIFLK